MNRHERPAARKSASRIIASGVVQICGRFHCLFPYLCQIFCTHRAAVIIYSRKAIMGQFHNLPVDSKPRSSRRCQ